MTQLVVSVHPAEPRLGLIVQILAHLIFCVYNCPALGECCLSTLGVCLQLLESSVIKCVMKWATAAGACTQCHLVLTHHNCPSVAQARRGFISNALSDLRLSHQVSSGVITPLPLPIIDTPASYATAVVPHWVWWLCSNIASSSPSSSLCPPGASSKYCFPLSCLWPDWWSMEPSSHMMSKWGVATSGPGMICLLGPSF